MRAVSPGMSIWYSNPHTLMKNIESTHAMPEDASLPEVWPLMLERLHTVGFTPHPEIRPRRCRTIIFNPSGTEVILMKRDRPKQRGYEPYYVFPGGALEPSDSSAIDGAWRELYEETGLGPTEVTLTGNVLEYGRRDQYLFLGVAHTDNPPLALAPDSPELHKSARVYGTYEPVFMPVERLASLILFPQVISRTLVEQASYL